MSTNIADLPGPKPEEFEDEGYEYEEEVMEEEEEYPQQQLPKEVYYEQPSSIKMDIKKVKRKIQEDESMFSLIQKEVNEENLLILVILYIASTSLVDDYAKKVLSLMSMNNSSSMIINIVKCVILLLAFILVKNYLLPYLKL
jgi:hypothetical protein